LYGGENLKGGTVEETKKQPEMCAILEDPVEQKRIENWVLIELFGHNTIAGLMSECSIGGCSFVRVDVPGTKDCPGYSKLFGNGAIYAITIVDEETARAAVEYHMPKPMTPWSAREMLKLDKGGVEWKDDRMRRDEETDKEDWT
jgi:hypothetical protein